MAPLVELEVALARLGLDPSDPKADDVARLLDAISTEIRRRTKRGFEGEGVAYDEIYRISPSPLPSPQLAWPGRVYAGYSSGMWIGGETELRLRHVPIASVTSLARVHWNGDVEPVLDASLWRLDDPERGILRVRSWAEYLRVISVVTVEIPDDVSQAALTWLESSWTAEPRDRALAGYTTGADSESYTPNLVGAPPAEAARVIAGYFHSTAGGPI